MGWLFEREGKRFVAIGDLIMPEGRLGYAGSVNFSPHQVLESLRKLDGLSVDTILPGHGPVVGPEKYVAAGIAIGSRVGWGKMTPEQPDPRFAIRQPNVLVTAFLAGAVSAAFGDIDGDGLPDVAVVAPHQDGSVVKAFLNRCDREGRFDPMQADFEIAAASVGLPSKIRLFQPEGRGRSKQETGKNAHPADIFIAGQSTAALLSRNKAGEYDLQTLPGNELHQLRVVSIDGSSAPVLLGRFSPAQRVVSSPNNRPSVAPLVPAL